MIDLSKNRDLKELADKFYLKVEDSLKEKMKEHEIFLNKFNTKSKHPLGDYLKPNLEGLITLEPQKLIDTFEYELSELIENEYKVTSKNIPSDFKRTIDEIFFYESHGKWKAYEFTKLLNINCCPYCNRTYITTLGTDNEKLVRADIDHFLPKKRYPFFRLSFFNLVPSCVICNRNAKRDKETKMDMHIHPYIEGFGENAKFTFKAKTYQDLIGKGKPEISFNYFGDKAKIKRIKENIGLFRLKEQYSIHHYEVNHLLALKEAFSESYIDDLIKRYPKLHLTKEQAYYYLFGLNLSEELDENQPLSKFKRDIIESLFMKIK